MYNKVLVPMDGSELAECVLSHVKALAKDGTAGEITILNVVAVDTRWSELYGKNFSVEAMRESLLASGRQYLDRVASQLAADGITVKTACIEGDRPATNITEYAEKNGMELIVIGTHGYTGLKKLFMGGVASEVLNTSPAPVLLIRPGSCRIF